MQLEPLHDKSKRPLRHFTPNRAVADRDGDLVAGVPGVEVGWSVLAIIHGDDDPEESTDDRHSRILRLCLGHLAPVAQRSKVIGFGPRLRT